MSFNDLERGHGSGSQSGRSGHYYRASPAVSDEDKHYKALTQDISQRVFRITSNVATMHNLVGLLGTARDTPELRAKLHKLTETTRELVKDTSNDIKTLSHYKGSSVQNQKLSQQKLSKDFQKTLTEFQRVVRLSAEKQREYVDKVKAHNLRNDVYSDDEDSGIPEEQPLIEDSQRRLQLQVLDNEIEYNESLIAEREEEIRGIEQGINELNEIFRDLGTLVTEQQSMLDNIESNVSNISNNMRNAAEELTVASRYQAKARNRMCCLLLIFAVIGAVVVLAALA